LPDKKNKVHKVAALLIKYRKRSALGKSRSRGTIDGKDISMKEIDRYVRRKGITQDELAQRAPVQTPPGIECGTPPDFGLSNSIPKSLEPATDLLNAENVLRLTSRYVLGVIKTPSLQSDRRNRNRFELMEFGGMEWPCLLQQLYDREWERGIRHIFSVRHLPIIRSRLFCPSLLYIPHILAGIAEAHLSLPWVTNLIFEAGSQRSAADQPYQDCFRLACRILKAMDSTSVIPILMKAIRSFFQTLEEAEQRTGYFDALTAWSRLRLDRSSGQVGLILLDASSGPSYLVSPWTTGESLRYVQTLSERVDSGSCTPDASIALQEWLVHRYRYAGFYVDRNWYYAALETLLRACYIHGYPLTRYWTEEVRWEEAAFIDIPSMAIPISARTIQTYQKCNLPAYSLSDYCFYNLLIELWYRLERAHYKEEAEELRYLCYELKEPRVESRYHEAPALLYAIDVLMERIAGPCGV
jgi:hypothetical protein